MAKEKIEKPQSLEKTLWAAADKLIGAVMPHDYMKMVLGLIFLKYVSDRFEAKYAQLVADGDGFERWHWEFGVSVYFVRAKILQSFENVDAVLYQSALSGQMEFRTGRSGEKVCAFQVFKQLIRAGPCDTLVIECDELVFHFLLLTVKFLSRFLPRRTELQK